MHMLRRFAALTVGIGLVGCQAPQVDFSTIKQPPRATELDAYEVFVGKWTWEAEALNADEKNKSWTGTAEWMWILDKRCLQGKISARSADLSYDASGNWSRDPRSGKYIWSMDNNWGYPQKGTASYDSESKTWTMPFNSVGLDGTTSHGKYVMKVTDNDTLDWHLTESVDMLGMFKKLEMKGTYKRAK
ncbi:MAG: hypothetical protein O7D94_13805 [Planctomycetota bacterium]|nr:hypothetical protein [Planctomycetota bacterium]